MSLRRTIKTRGSFPSDEGAIQLPFLVLRHAATVAWRDLARGTPRFTLVKAGG